MARWFANTFVVPPEDADGFWAAAWAADAAIMKRQPGFISTQLHRGVAGSGAFLNYAVWELVAHFRAAFANPEFRARLGEYPENATASPHLFRRSPCQASASRERSPLRLGRLRAHSTAARQRPRRLGVLTPAF